MIGLMDGRTDRWMDRWMDGWMDGSTQRRGGKGWRKGGRGGRVREARLVSRQGGMEGRRREKIAT